MNDPKNTESRLALIGLTVLVVCSFLAFAIIFFDAGNLFSSSSDTPSTDHVSVDPSADQADKILADIAEAKTKLEEFQGRLDSPYLMPVNEQSPIPEGYTVELMALSHTDGSLSLDKAAASAMNAFLASAEGAGYHVSLEAAYRSEAQQQKVYDEKFKSFRQAGYSVTEAKELATAAVGSVNHSEHQLGLAVDFNAKDLEQAGADGTLFKDYLKKNIYKFGFILSYPAGSQESTGRDPNGTHYRYVGLEIAEDMNNRGYTLTEYRGYLQNQITYYQQQITMLEKQ